MNTLLASNNAFTTIEAPLDVAATSIFLTAGTGARFPSLAADQIFIGTLSNATGSLIEIVNVTARSGDVLTVERAQQGTVDQEWPAGSLFQNLVTSGTFDFFAQWSQVVPVITLSLTDSVIDLAAYAIDNLAARVVLKLTAASPIEITNIIGVPDNTELVLVIAENSANISLPYNTAPFALSSISGPYGWPGYPLSTITLFYAAENSIFKWLELARSWRVS